MKGSRTLKSLTANGAKNAKGRCVIATGVRHAISTSDKNISRRATDKKFCRFIKAKRLQRMSRLHLVFVFVALFAVNFLLRSSLRAAEPTKPRIVETGPSEQLVLPPPNATRAVANPAGVIPWPKDKTP